MKNKRNKLILVEGPQGVGKTTLTNYLREKILYTNLYRLTGHNDSSPSGLEKSRTMYENLLNYIDSLSGCGLNLVFDRIYTTEKVYCDLGYRKYEYTDLFDYLNNKLNSCDFDIIVLNLYLENTENFAKRFDRDGKKQHHNIQFCAQNSIDQQNAYMKNLEHMNKTCDNISLYNIAMDDFKKGYEEINSILGIN